jgi:hypothetical protein
MEEHQRVAVGCSHTDPVKGCGWTRVIIFGQEYKKEHYSTSSKEAKTITGEYIIKESI